MYINLICDSLLIVFLVGLEDELIAELDHLQAASLLSSHNNIPVLSHLYGCYHVFELKYL